VSGRELEGAQLKAAFVQTSPVFGEVRTNVDRAVAKIEKLDASLIVLPELFSTGYQFRSKKELMELAEESL
jgi:predicted amidohydrolase